MNKRREQEIVAKLLRLAKSGCEEENFLLEPDSEPYQLICDLENNSHAFVIGCVLDRMISAEKAWAAPYKLKQRVGGFSFSRLRRLTPDDWEKYLGKQNGDPKSECLHINWRNVKQGMPQCLYSAMQIIDECYNGDAWRMWSDNNLPGKEVVRRFKKIRGVGDKIANMAVRILVTKFKLPIKTDSIDISVDIHISRVVRRLGLIDNDTPKRRVKKLIVDKAQELSPAFPAKIDRPIFIIGRNFCHETNPNCGDCPMTNLCDYALAPAPQLDNAE